MNNIICIAGPTASGKTALAVALAKELNGEVVSCDSMQVYRGLDIGTAKEDPSVRARIPHKLIDVVNPSDEFSVAEFARMAKIEIEKAQNEGKLPIVVGGTGLYFEALLYPMSFSHTNKNEELRANLQDELQRIGAHAMHEKLANLDPETANRPAVGAVLEILPAHDLFDHREKLFFVIFPAGLDGGLAGHGVQ